MGDGEKRPEAGQGSKDILQQVAAVIVSTRERVEETKAVLEQSRKLIQKSRELTELQTSAPSH
jgi:hypothetical protein